MRPRLLAVLLSLLVLCPVTVSFAAGDLTLTVINVGQGDSIFIDFPNGKHALIDAGPGVSGPTVVKFLRDHNVSTLDLLVLTHPDEDHIGGMATVLKAFTVLNVWDSEDEWSKSTRADYKAALTKQGLTPTLPELGKPKQMGGDKVYITVLGPPQPYRSKTNNDSIVLRLVYDKVSFLLPGDMEKQERNDIANGKPWPHDTLLKAAHHGSYNGTGCAFAQQVSPDYTVISYADGNSFAHPHVEAITALSFTPTQVYATAANGNVTFTTDGTELDPPVMERTGLVAVPDGHSIHCPNATEQASVADLTSDVTYLGNASTKVFHRATCPIGAQLLTPVHFNTPKEATDAGYAACGTCKPLDGG